MVPTWAGPGLFRSKDDDVGYTFEQNKIFTALDLYVLELLKEVFK